jgi:hypothetical protein
MTTPAAPLEAAPAPAAKPASRWEDFVDIVFAPAQVFARRRDGRFWLPLLVFVVLNTGLFVAARPLMAPVFDHMASVQEAKMRRDNPQLTDEQVGVGRRMQEKFTSGWIGAGAVAVGQTLMVLGVALMLWLFAKPFGSGASYGQAATVTAFAFVPRLLATALSAALLLVTGAEHATTVESIGFSPARFLAADASPLLSAVLGRFDLFVLWTTALLGVGIALMGRPDRRPGSSGLQGTMTRGQGLAAAGAVWLAASLWAVFQAFKLTA